MNKKFFFSLAFCALFSVTAFAQDLQPVLSETAEAFFKAKDPSDKISQSNKLSLIARKFDKEWAAAYYAGLSKIMLSYEEPDNGKKDAYLDEADDLISTAATLSDKNNAKQQSEIYTITAMAANARIGVDPQKRWRKYGKIFDDNLEQAKAQNEENPRIYFLKGTSTFYTPKAFGGGKEKALEYFERAKAYFETENKDDIMVPSWGAETNEYFLQQCQEAGDAD